MESWEFCAFFKKITLLLNLLTIFYDNSSSRWSKSIFFPNLELNCRNPSIKGKTANIPTDLIPDYIRNPSGNKNVHMRYECNMH